MPASSTTSAYTSVSDKLSRCKQKFELWRKEQSSKAGKPIIPDSLWNETIKLTPELSISRIATELRLNQARLRLKQFELGSSQKTIQESKQESEFLELQHPVTFPSLSASTISTSSDLHFSIQKTDGSRLTLSLPSSQDKLAETLFISFLQA